MFEDLIQEVHDEVDASRCARGLLPWKWKKGIPSSVSSLAENIFDGQNGPEEFVIDKDHVIQLRSEGKTWSQVAAIIGLSAHRVYHACRKLDPPRPKTPSKWEEIFRQLSKLKVNDSITVTLPNGSTRSQMNSALNMNQLTNKWHWSLTDNKDGTVAVVKLNEWTSVVNDAKNKKENIASLKLSPQLAETIWDNLSFEQKAQIMDVDAIWDSFDDLTKMSMISKVSLVC